jgi:5-methylcytosine-specific restriction endonuclease McrA
MGISGQAGQWAPGGGKWIRVEKRLGIYLRDGFGCVWCMMSLTDAHPRMVTLDHLVPRSEDGTNSAENLVTACMTCNTRRGTMSVRAFAEMLGTESFPASTQDARSFARDIVRRVNRQRRVAPNVALARAILAGVETDPRPIVVEARRTGQTLAPKGSAAHKNVTRANRRSQKKSGE